MTNRNTRCGIYSITTPNGSQYIGSSIKSSDGRSFKNMADAARAFGVRVAGIRHLVQTQRVGRLGVRFKLAADEWREVPSVGEQRKATMRARGTNVRSAEVRARMSAAKRKNQQEAVAA